jgi:hypothetical protein
VSVYVLRCWLEPLSSGAGAWRASLYDPNSRERVFFSDPTELSHYLTDLEPVAALEQEFDAPPTQRSNP